MSLLEKEKKKESFCYAFLYFEVIIYPFDFYDNNLNLLHLTNT